MNVPHLTDRLIKSLQEDGAFSDITTRALPHVRRQQLSARIIAKESGIFCGAFLVREVFRLLGSRARVGMRIRDGARIRPGQTVAVVRVNATVVLGGERLVLNLLSRLSGIATLTASYVNAVRDTKARIL